MVYGLPAWRFPSFVLWWAMIPEDTLSRRPSISTAKYWKRPPTLVRLIYLAVQCESSHSPLHIPCVSVQQFNLVYTTCVCCERGFMHTMEHRKSVHSWEKCFCLQDPVFLGKIFLISMRNFPDMGADSPNIEEKFSSLNFPIFLISFPIFPNFS